MQVDVDNVLTKARESLWDSLDVHADTNGLFTTKIKLDNPNSMIDAIPSISDMPAILIGMAQVTPEWIVNIGQKWPINYDVVIWTPEWDHRPGETAIVRCIRAFYNAQVPGRAEGLSFIKAATGYHPFHIGPITMTRLMIGPEDEPEGQHMRAMRTQCQITLRTDLDPFNL